MRKNYLISLLALSAMAVSASSMAKENVTVSGSTTVLPVMQKISEHLMQKDHRTLRRRLRQRNQGSE